ncbi:uncharacterized protein PHACADRAFT_174812 [Phanerochaete carnosa HHB-10118-sp]|uniref:Uncharacterized protein n=1 Tax=Phanerochaete carnosa (strain HHB-10118-sp) TaxID=650164 RepID=K5W5V3_PHACS|nr:uncharacterized protein PHACADRAFT_174812 [Phanerochaete carnosa HHB-10118-sp]EKM54319.1 hypothetical protein PHACADRAFT_174812 [Phanerochaete carnosa HHB-10118-sp]
MASLRSAFTLSYSPPLRCSLASSNLPLTSKAATLPMRESKPPEDASPNSALPKLALSSPMNSFHVSLSPSTSVDITAAYSPSLLYSPFQRPHAPTPGSVESRLFAYAHSDVDHHDVEHRTDFLTPAMYDRSLCRLSTNHSLEGILRSPSSPFCRPRAPTPGSLASISPHFEMEDTPSSFRRLIWIQFHPSRCDDCRAIHIFSCCSQWFERE